MLSTIHARSIIRKYISPEEIAIMNSCNIPLMYTNKYPKCRTIKSNAHIAPSLRLPLMQELYEAGYAPKYTMDGSGVIARIPRND